MWPIKKLRGYTIAKIAAELLLMLQASTFGLVLAPGPTQSAQKLEKSDFIVKN